MAKNQTLQHKRSTVAGNVPTTSQVAIGGLAINFADSTIYTQTAAGTIIPLADDIFSGAAFLGTPSAGDLWWDTTQSALKSWDGTQWINAAFTGLPVLPGSTTSLRGFSGGSGTLATPYLYSTTASVGADYIVDTITITGLAANQFVPIIDLNASANGGRYRFTNNFANSAGTLIFNIEFTDVPSSANGTSYLARIKIGTGTVYINTTITVSQPFPQSLNGPTNTLAATTTWTATNDTLTSTGSLLISTNGSTFNTGPLSITTGATLYLKWSGSAGSGTGIDSAHGSTITGTVVSSAGGISSHSLTIDKQPTAFTFTAQTGVALSSIVQSNKVTLSGFNSYTYLTSANTMKSSIDDGSWTTVPASGTTMSAISGQTLEVEQTSSSSASTATTVTISASGVTSAFTVTTGNNTVVTPSITTPTAGATGISPTATIVASAYAVTGTVGTHLNSDWEIYSNAGLTTLVTSSMASTTNLTTWTPSGLGNTTQYWVRVRYRSNDGVVSSWSPSRNWTTGVLQIYYPLTSTSTDPTDSLWRAIHAPAGYTFVPNDGIYVNSSITNMQWMFKDASTFNDPDISTWNVSAVTDMSETFSNSVIFNQPLSGWNTSNVTSMVNMFNCGFVAAGGKFNQPIGNWNTSKVTLLAGMFAGQPDFNQDISGWDTSNVTLMQSMFNCDFVAAGGKFNQPIGNWNTAKVTNMIQMFSNQKTFNQPIGAWNTSNVTSMLSTFNGATAFNGNIGSWSVSNVANADSMFNSASSFNQNLSTWVTGLTTQPTNFSQGANATWVASKATTFPFLQGGTIRINT